MSDSNEATSHLGHLPNSWLHAHRLEVLHISSRSCFVGDCFEYGWSKVLHASSQIRNRIDSFGVCIGDKEMQECGRQPRTRLLLSIAHEGSGVASRSNDYRHGDVHGELGRSHVIVYSARATPRV